MKSMKNNCKKIVLAIVVIISIVFVIGGPYIYNDFILYKFSSQLFHVDLPDDIVLVDKIKVTGKLNGNGNSMDFLACILVKSERSQKEIGDYFDDFEFKTAKNNGVCEEIEVVKVNDKKLNSKYLQHKEVVFDVKENAFEDYYAIIIYDGGYSADFDLRGR